MLEVYKKDSHCGSFIRTLSKRDYTETCALYFACHHLNLKMQHFFNSGIAIQVYIERVSEDFSLGLNSIFHISSEFKKMKADFAVFLCACISIVGATGKYNFEIFIK